MAPDDAVLLSSLPWKEMPGCAGIAECMEEYERPRMHIISSVHALYTTDPTILSACVMNAILGLDTFLPLSVMAISLN